MPNVYKAKAPGSCMFFGEYAVLEAHPAIVGALDQYIEVTLTARTDRFIHVLSSLGEVLAPLDNFPHEPPFQFIAACIAHMQPYTYGFDLRIDSQLSTTLGLGSSAAITVATLACLYRYTQKIFTPQELLIDARSLIQRVQGCGSGADVAASIYGGLIHYDYTQATIIPLLCTHALHLIYCGYKTPTATAIHSVYEQFKYRKDTLKEIYQDIGACVALAKHAIEHHNTIQLERALTFNQKLMTKLGVCDDTLTQLLNDIHSLPAIIGAKISGSGLGDCILVIGELAPHTFPRNSEQAQQGVRQIDIHLSTQGLELHEWIE